MDQIRRNSGLALYAQGPISGLTPITQEIVQNLDYSSFPLLVESVYRDMNTVEGRLPYRLPYDALLHHCTSALIAAQIDVLQHENKMGLISAEGNIKFYLDGFVIPSPIAEYIEHATTTYTQQGDKVLNNIPKIAIPISAAGDTAGTFGPVDTETHNVYECYVCPRTTRRRIEAQAAAPPRSAPSWTPLPEELMPDKLQATPNFLGYGPLTAVVSEARYLIQNLDFPDGITGLEARMQFSHGLNSRVNAVLRSIEGKYKMTTGAQLKCKTIPGFVGFLEVKQPVPSTTRLSTVSATLWSSNSAGRNLATAMYLWGLKRRRTATAAGLCFVTAAGAAPDGWIQTRNSNFDLIAPFTPIRGIDRASLRERTHFAEPLTGSRSVDLDDFLNRNFHVK